jgi:hypothetical protein
MIIKMSNISYIPNIISKCTLNFKLIICNGHIEYVFLFLFYRRKKLLSDFLAQLVRVERDLSFECHSFP